MKLRFALPVPAPCLVLPLALSLTAGCFPKGPGPRLAHFEHQAPAVGEPAPTFELRGLDGETVRLEELLGDKPIVLQLGSHSCPVYRYRRFDMEDLARDFGDRVHFLLIYTLEAHPKGSKSPYEDEEWVSLPNRVTGVFIDQPKDLPARTARAEFSAEKLKLPHQVLVDSMDNAVWSAYGSASSPAFVIDRHGNIASSQVWIDPKEIRRVLEELLAE